MEGVAGKVCTKCGEFKPFDAYHANPRMKDGYKSACKVCLSAEYKLWRASNASAVAKRLKTWREENKTHVQEYKRAYGAANKDKKSEWDKRTYAKHRDERLAKNAVYRRCHQEFISELNRAYRIANPEKARQNRKNTKHRRRAFEKGGAVRLPEWQAILAAFGDKCAYCGCSEKKLEMDHLMPLSRGGKHVASNIVPACRTCNVSKSKRSVAEWVASGSPYAPAEIPGWVELRVEG